MKLILILADIQTSKIGAHLGHKKLARIHWKADALKTSHCLMWILAQRHNWDIFLRKWARRGCYSQWRSLSGFWFRGIVGHFSLKMSMLLSGHVERIVVHKNWRGEYWQHFVLTRRCYMPHSRSYTRCFAPCFWRSHYQQRSWCRLATTELRFDTVGILFVGCRQR